MLCWRTSFLITSACVRGSGQWSRATNNSKSFARIRQNSRSFTRIHSMPGSLCAAGGWRGCWRPLWASQRMSSWKNRGQYSNRVASWIFSIFCVFNNSQPLASLLGRQNTCFFELWCRRDAFFENRNRYGSIPVAMSKKKVATVCHFLTSKSIWPEASSNRFSVFAYLTRLLRPRNPIFAYLITLLQPRNTIYAYFTTLLQPRNPIFAYLTTLLQARGSLGVARGSQG